MIARVKFGYTMQEIFIEAAKDADALAILRDVLGAGVPIDENLGTTYCWPTETVIDLDVDGPRLTALGVSFEVVSFKGTLKQVVPGTDGQPVTVYVQVPSIGLLTISEVRVEENACTDTLQGLLDDGWRLLCVCPPNSQRRPDYILGRTKEEHR